MLLRRLYNEADRYMCMAKMANPQEGVFEGASIGFSANIPVQSVTPHHRPGTEDDPN